MVACFLVFWLFFFLLGAHVSWNLLSIGILWGLGLEGVSSEICVRFCQVPLLMVGQSSAGGSLDHVRRINSGPKPKWGCAVRNSHTGGFPRPHFLPLPSEPRQDFLSPCWEAPTFCRVGNVTSHLAQAQTLSPQALDWSDAPREMLALVPAYFPGNACLVPSKLWRFSFLSQVLEIF